MYKFVLVLALALVSVGCSKEKGGVKKVEELTCKELCKSVYVDCVDAFILYTVEHKMEVGGLAGNRRGDVRKLMRDKEKMAEGMFEICVRQCKKEKGKKYRSPGYGVAEACYKEYGSECAQVGTCAARVLAEVHGK